ncbi:MAG: hypothetical protein J7D61_07705, partial [Marichromatium sp.]|nr:hypothetical protein [Marichromatium sp.]
PTSPITLPRLDGKDGIFAIHIFAVHIFRRLAADDSAPVASRNPRQPAGASYHGERSHQRGAVET